ncbi:helix-turn-helix transcriptional regulator [uncultured Anaerococcus sp.]|uniref:helix-turn-helix transcriptional regulator n=1 Tax=uncultured Anaerococcus sp. TaxID=293428 RepID=UPI00288C5DB5|nr:helix-turn-helix transcriptional regulator [uncultured Anaerococcus sp.]
MKKIKELRIKNNLSQKEMGKIIGVNGRAIGNYERGIRALSVDKAKKLGEYFKFNWWELYED